MMFILMIQLLFLEPMSGFEYDCDIDECSNIFDYVCGKVETDSKIITWRFQNICYLRKTQCKLQGIAETTAIPLSACSKLYPKESRRVFDFTIVGARQACNHSCPTYCRDTYEPVCAKIWQRGMKRSSNRPMVNHCHIDLFSCAIGVNVTILPLGSCYKNPGGLMFMSQIAAMKSLRLLESRRTTNQPDGTTWLVNHIKYLLTKNKSHKGKGAEVLTSSSETSNYSTLTDTSTHTDTSTINLHNGTSNASLDN